MDVVLVLNAAGDLVPAAGAFNAHPGALQGDIHNVADLGLGDDGDGFKLVTSRKYGMTRGKNHAREEMPVEPEYAVELEYEWTPRTGPLRRVKKWAQLRKGGCIITAEGLAVLTYPCIIPEEF